MNQKLISHSNYVLRKVLNNEQYVDIIQDLIEAILKIEIKEIKLNPYLQEESEHLPREENFGVADVRIRTKDNEEMNIGIQFIDGKHIDIKMLIYYAQIHANQLKYDAKREIARTVTINFLNTAHFSSPKYHKRIALMSNETDIKLQALEMHAIEFPRFFVQDIEHITKEEEWIIYLTGKDSKIINDIKKRNKKIEKLDNLIENYWDAEKME